MSVYSGLYVPTDSALEIAADFGNLKSFDNRENLVSYSDPSSNWSITGDTTRIIRTTNILNNFVGAIITTTTGTNWHRTESLYSINLINGTKYTLSFYYRPGTSLGSGFLGSSARLQIRCNSQESFVQGPVNGSSWSLTQNTGAVTNVSTVLLEDGLTYKTTYNFTSNQTATAALGIGVGENTANAKIIALGAQIQTGDYASTYYPTTGTAKTLTTTVNDLVGKHPVYATTTKTALNTVTCLDYNTSQNIRYVFTNPLPLYGITVMYWGRGTGIPSSNYRNLWQFKNSLGYYYFNADTRETTSPYILFYVKDYALSVWNTKNVLNNANYLLYTWNHFAITINSPTQYTCYLNGVSLGAVTITVDVASYGSITDFYLNASNGNSYNVSSAYVYSRALSASEVLLHYNITKKKFGF